MLPSATGAPPAAVPDPSAQPDPPIQATRIQLVGIRKVTDKPLTNRGDLKERLRFSRELLSDSICDPMATADLQTPRTEFDSVLEPNARENAQGFDRHVLRVVDALLGVVDRDVQDTCTETEPEGKPYDQTGADNALPICESAKEFWLNQMPAMRLFATDKPELNAGVNLAVRFANQPDSEFSKGKDFTRQVLKELAAELGLPVTDPFIKLVYDAFENEHISEPFEGLKILEQILLKAVLNNRFVFNTNGEKVAKEFVARYPESLVSPLLVFDDVNVATGEIDEATEGDSGASGSDTEVEGATAAVSALKF